MHSKMPNLRIVRVFGTIAASLFCLAAINATASIDNCTPTQLTNTTIQQTGDQLIVALGSDEDRQQISVEIWGSERRTISCEKLDDDPDAELVIISRGSGSGPYYRLQIIDPTFITIIS